jgi:hypothetical protein
MTSTSAAEQSGASRRGLLARYPWHPPRRDDHPRETTSGEGVVLGSKRAEQMIADRKESLDPPSEARRISEGLRPEPRAGWALFTEMPRAILGKPAATPAGSKPPQLYSPMARGDGQ